MKQTFNRLGTRLAPSEAAIRLWIVAGLLACMCSVVAVSQVWLMHESLRLDESQSIMQTGQSLGGVLHSVAQDVHMPLYHVLLHLWTIVFGNGVAAVRALSLIFFLLTIPCVYLLARQALSRGWAFLVTVLFSLSPFMNWYANEARMYTLLVLFSVLNQYFFLRILKRKKGWLGYSITAIIGAYSHYFFLFNLLTQGLFYVSNYRKFAPGSFKRFIAIAVGLGLALGPWVYYFIEQGAAGNMRPLIEAPTTVNYFNAYSQFLFGFQTDVINTIIVSFWPLLVVVSFFTVKRHLRLDGVVMYLLFAAFLPVLLAFGLSFVVTPFFLSRYMLSVVAPLFVVIAWLMSRYAKRGALVLAVLWLAIIGLTFRQQTYSLETPVRENYQPAVRYIQAHATIHDVIVLSSPFTVFPFEYYYNGPLQIKTLPDWERYEVGSVPAYDRQALPRQVENLKVGHDHIYLLVSYDQGYEDEVVNYFETRYEQTDEKEFSNDLRLLVYRVGYQEVPESHPRAAQR